eukprot:m.233685 g.233685  ORF g.233685 m.233685 type:complete len:328 (-) comp19300_c0_seq3:563-1546(-)
MQQMSILGYNLHFLRTSEGFFLGFAPESIPCSMPLNPAARFRRWNPAPRPPGIVRSSMFSENRLLSPATTWVISARCRRSKPSRSPPAHSSLAVCACVLSAIPKFSICISVAMVTETGDLFLMAYFANCCACQESTGTGGSPMELCICCTAVAKGIHCTERTSGDSLTLSSTLNVSHSPLASSLRALHSIACNLLFMLAKSTSASQLLRCFSATATKFTIMFDFPRTSRVCRALNGIRTGPAPMGGTFSANSSPSSRIAVCIKSTSSGSFAPPGSNHSPGYRIITVFDLVLFRKFTTCDWPSSTSHPEVNVTVPVESKKCCIAPYPP